MPALYFPSLFWALVYPAEREEQVSGYQCILKKEVYRLRWDDLFLLSWDTEYCHHVLELVVVPVAEIFDLRRQTLLLCDADVITRVVEVFGLRRKILLLYDEELVMTRVADSAALDDLYGS
ncbi:hypothetical protein N7540_009619 [Penicillium herquei]|nr:hypothetical protein N7540_009619 [Penicillium herquei]